MERNYANWHYLKSTIERNHTSPLFGEREIWWCALGANIGFEEDGKNELFERPVLVLKKFNKEMFWGLPLTSRPKEGMFYFSLQEGNRTVILSQLRTLSPKRLLRKLGKIGKLQFQLIQKAATGFINETDPLRGPRVPSGNL